MKLFISIIFTVLSIAAQAAVVPYKVQTMNPEREVGYFVGDTIDRTIDIEIPHSYKLSMGSLPVKGVIRNGIQLRDIKLTEKRTSKITHYHLKLSYQVFTRGDYAKKIALPNETLILSKAAKLIRLKIPTWKFKVSPIASKTEVYLAQDMSPYRGPMLVEFGYLKPLLGSGLVLVLISLAGLIYINCDATWFPGMGGAFAASYRKIEALQNNPVRLKDAVYSLHQAFNETYGESLFEHGVSQFTTENLNFKNVKTEITQFFEISDHVLFSKQGDNFSYSSLEELRSLAEKFRHCERGLV